MLPRAPVVGYFELGGLRRQVAELDRQLLALVHGDETCRRLMTVPGVGAVTAVTFVATIEDPGLFRRSRSIDAYLGLTPTRCESARRLTPDRRRRLTPPESR